jgi:hypothetical protein
MSVTEGNGEDGLGIRNRAKSVANDAVWTADAIVRTFERAMRPDIRDDDASSAGGRAPGAPGPALIR